MTSRFLLTCSFASAALGCTVGTTMPFGSTRSTYYGPRPQAPPVVAADDTASDDEAAPTPGPARLACVRDRAGVDFASATKIGRGTVRGCIDGASSVDVYALTAGANAGGTIFGIKVAAKDTVCAKLFDQDRKAATGSECAWRTNTEYLWAAVAPNTTVFVRLERSNKVISPYKLDITEQLIADDEEPNNGWKAAVPLALEQPHEALLADVLNDSGTTKDLYKIKLAKAAKLEIVVDPSGDDVKPEVTIFDRDRRKVGHGESRNRGAILREKAELPAGTYYVQVEEAGWGIGYGNGPAGSDSHASDKPTGHFSKPYTLEVNVKGDSRKKKRVSKR